MHVKHDSSYFCVQIYPSHTDCIQNSTINTRNAPSPVVTLGGVAKKKVSFGNRRVSVVQSTHHGEIPPYGCDAYPVHLLPTILFNPHEKMEKLPVLSSLPPRHDIGAAHA